MAASGARSPPAGAKPYQTARSYSLSGAGPSGRPSSPSHPWRRTAPQAARERVSQTAKNRAPSRFIQVHSLSTMFEGGPAALLKKGRPSTVTKRQRACRVIPGSSQKCHALIFPDGKLEAGQVIALIQAVQPQKVGVRRQTTFCCKRCRSGVTSGPSVSTPIAPLRLHADPFAGHK